MRPSKLRLPDNTDTATRWESVMALPISSGKGPELPMQVVQPYPTRLNLSAFSASSRPAARRYSVITLEPGARQGLTHGLTSSPFSTALRASRPAAIMTDGLDVLVHEVMAAITTEPWVSSK